MTQTKLLPTKYKNFLAQHLQMSIDSVPNTSYYVYAGVHGNVIGDIPEPKNNNRELNVNAWHNMIFGKRVYDSDVSLVIRNVPYVGNKVFAMSDDSDPNIAIKDYYCYVEEGSFFHVFKCLNNNFGANSTVAPSYTFVTEEANYIFETSDGYMWKYMYSVADNDKEKFSTPNYFPVSTNTAISNNAVRGSIDVIFIEQTNLDIPGGGKKYDNYVTGTFTTDQLRVNGNNILYAISNTIINHQTGFYTGCRLYLSEGAGAGQHTVIDHYFTNETGNYIVLANAFVEQPLNGTTFEIYPDVNIKGAGTETVIATARALVNATGSNSIYKIEMLDRGKDYDYMAATVVANGVVTQDINFIEAELRPIYPPMNGHGYNAPLELGSSAIEFSVKFDDTFHGTLPIKNRYQQLGIIIDPTFANVNIEIANAQGYFLEGEQIVKIDPLRINSNVNISSTSNTITGRSSVLSSITVVSEGNTGSYVPEDILTIEGGIAIAPAEVKVLTTSVRSVTINAVGSGYTPGSFTANLNLGTVTTNATFTVTANSEGKCDTIIITNPGVFTANPPFLANSTPVEGVTGSGLTVLLEMGLDTIEIFDPGTYALIPTDLATNEPISNIGTGTGAELLIAFSTTLTADFVNQLDPGDYVYIVSADETQQQLATVDSITNATSIELSTEGLFSCSIASMYLPNITTVATVNNVANSTNIFLSKVFGELDTSDLLVGKTSSSKAQIASINRNNVEKNLDSFIQLYKYDITVLSGEFNENEVIYQGNSLDSASATALLHSIDTDVLYCSNQVGQFSDAVYIQGANSFAIASISGKYMPELDFCSGKVIYIENLESVYRADNQTETFQIILTF